MGADPEGLVDPWVVATAVLGTVAVLGYLLAVRHSRPRPGTARRCALWVGGVVVATTAVAGPLEEAADDSFTVHALTHLMLGMLAPLLLAAAAPVTLALRTLPVPAARRLSRVLRSPPLRVLTEPTVAAVLNLGGLWLLYRTPLLALAQQHPAVHLLVHAHMFTSGYLFTLAMTSWDPSPHRRSFRHRVVVLVVALAAHDVLAKYLYGHPPRRDGGPGRSGRHGHVLRRRRDRRPAARAAVRGGSHAPSAVRR